MTSLLHKTFPAALVLGSALSLPACGGESNDEAEDNGATMNGGSSGASGSPPTGGGGTTAGSAGTAPTGGGTTPTGGTAGMATGGSSPTGGSSGSSSGGTGGTTAPGCGTTVNVNLNPFGCGFAWGSNGDVADRSSYLQFITAWIGYEPFPPNNRPNDCDGCGVVRDLATTNAVPVFYAYYIGYAATADGFGDCNTDANLDLCTNGAQWIRDHRQQILDFYEGYAAKAYMANPNKPVVWLLDGDFMQYTETSQQPSPLTVAELGTLANDITCAIKSNAPNAVVALNHTPWNGNEETDAFFDAVNLDIVDMVWTTGVGNNSGLINLGADAQEYNATSARYSYIYEYTGKTLFVDTSFGPSQQADSWSNNGADVLNDRIAEGVIAANVTQPPTDYRTRITSLAPMLESTCQ